MRARRSGLGTQVLAVAVCVAMGVACPLRADNGNATDEIANVGDTWHVDLYAWVWMFGISGDVGAGPVQINGIDASLLDIADESDSIVAFSGRLEVGSGRLTGFIDGTYADIGIDDVSGPLGFGDVDVTVEVGFVDFGLMYQLTEWETNQRAKGSLEVYAGARYFDGSIKLEPALAATRKRDRDWVDPIVGARVKQPLSEKFHLDVWGDVGGFGVESDLTWSATAVLGYDFDLFKLPATVYAGYRAVGWDHTEGSGADRFEWDVILHGPMLGLVLRF